MSEYTKPSRGRTAAAAAVAPLVLVALLFPASASVSRSYQVRIDSAVVDFDEGVIRISGDNFGFRPRVILGGQQLDVVSYTTHDVEALLPDDIGPGTYAVVVYRNRLNQDIIDVTLGYIPLPAPGDDQEPG